MYGETLFMGSLQYLKLKNHFRSNQNSTIKEGNL